MAAPLSDAEAYELWMLWKAAHERVEGAVIAAATAASGLTDAEIAVLLRLDAAGGRLRQGELGRRLGWQRSRLSHQLTRMSARDLVVREGTGAQVEVLATDEASRRLDAARPAHVAAVHRHLVDPLPDPASLRSALEALRTSASDRRPGQHAGPVAGHDDPSGEVSDAGTSRSAP